MIIRTIQLVSNNSVIGLEQNYTLSSGLEQTGIVITCNVVLSRTVYPCGLDLDGSSRPEHFHHIGCEQRVLKMCS